MNTGMNKVDTLVAQMIRAYPSLRSTRWDALLEISGNYEATWDADGNISIGYDSVQMSEYAVDETGIINAQERLDAALAAGNASPEAIEQHKANVADEFIHQHGDRDRYLWIREHADVLAQCRRRKIRNGGSSSHFKNLQMVPDNIDPEWKRAFIEMAQEVVYTPFNEAKYSHYTADYRDRARNEWATTVGKAKDFLIRMKGTDTEKKALMLKTYQDKLAALMIEAERAGVVITATVA
jgi:hypothetical protein